MHYFYIATLDTLVLIGTKAPYVCRCWL